MKQNKFIAPLIILIILFVSINVNALIVEKRPLYTDPTGWQIWGAKDMDTMLETYYWPAVNANVYIPPAWNQIRKDESEKYIALTLWIPPGMQLWWGPHAKIVAKFEYDGKYYNVTSERICVLALDDTGLITNDGAFPTPSMNDAVFTTTQRHHPILFVKFPFTNRPDAILECRVESVSIKDRR